MILYHGTNADFDRISLTIGLRYKDFGWGFYMTPDRKTAVRMAQKKARLFGGEPTLITYELDEAVLQSDLKIKRFPEKACVEWGVVSLCRCQPRPQERQTHPRLRHCHWSDSQRRSGAPIDQLPRGHLFARRGCPSAPRPLPRPAVLLRN